jgi:hypothetical protein
LLNMREDDHNIILRKHREVQRYSFQNISTQVNKFQVSTQTIYCNACEGLSPFPNLSIRRLPIGSNFFEHCQMIGSYNKGN